MTPRFPPLAPPARGAMPRPRAMPLPALPWGELSLMALIFAVLVSA